MKPLYRVMKWDFLQIRTLLLFSFV